MNRLILSGNPQTIRLAFGDTDITSTASAEKVIVDMGVGNIDNFPIASSDDGIYFGRKLEEFEITNPGGNIVKVNDIDGNAVFIVVNTSGKIGFTDGETDIELDGITPMISGQPLSTTPLDPTTVTLSDLPSEIEEGGEAGSSFTRIIDGGNAFSQYV